MQTKSLSQILQCASSNLPNRLDSSHCLSKALFKMPPCIPVFGAVLPPHAPCLEEVFQLILPPRRRPTPPTFPTMWDFSRATIICCQA